MTSSLLKKIDVSTRDNKLRSRAFVDYLIDYNSTNIFPVWNLEKDNVSDYKDVIFDESELYNSYNQNDQQMLQKEKVNYTNVVNSTNIHNFVKLSINQVIELDSDDDKWLKIMIRDRLVFVEKRSIEKVEHDEKSVDLNQAKSVDSLVDSFSKLKLIDSIKSAKKFILFKTSASF